MTLDKVSPGLVEDFLRILRQQFYYDAPKKAFFYDRTMLFEAITHPAVYLKQRGISREVSEQEYRDILTKIIREIQGHGDTANIRHFGRYFLTSVQKHMLHQGDVYYQEASAIRSIQADYAMGLLSPRKKVPAVDHTVEILAHAAKLAAQKRGKKKPAPLTQAEPDLFACTPLASPVQKVRKTP